MRISWIVFLVGTALAQSGDWPTYNHDLGGTRYSPLTQINTSNVAKLHPAWIFQTEVKESVAKFLYDETRRRPMVLPVRVEV